jgi:4,5-dihydroxyphthalate decarboxylase
MTTLSAMLGSYPKTVALKNHSVSSPLVQLDFADIEVAQKGFKDVVRETKYDVAELAIVTFLLAHEARKPYLLLPFVMNGGFHHKSILCRAGSGLVPRELADKNVAMRSYSQTTPTWVRGILSDEYGVHTPDVHWLTREGAHVAEYEDPAWTTRIGSDHSLEELLVSGEVDAIIAGSGLSGDPRVQTLIPQPDEAALEWYRRTHVVPINHVVTIRKEIADTRPDLVRAVFRLLVDSRAATGPQPSPGPDLQPTGFADVRTSIETAIRFAHEQELISKEYAVEELYGSVRGALT